MLEILESRLLMSRTWIVSTLGDDHGPGTLAQPLKTIQQAALVAQPGDTVLIRGGTYHETVKPAHSGTPTAPITYSAYGNEIVTIDGADTLTGWTRDANAQNIYSTQQPWDLGDGNNQVFADGVALNEACWPNTALGQSNRRQRQSLRCTAASSARAGTFWLPRRFMSLPCRAGRARGTARRFTSPWAKAGSSRPAPCCTAAMAR